MYTLSAKIEIRGERTWRFGAVSSIEVTRDTEQLTDICKLTLPKRIKWDGQKEIPIRRGDSIRVWTGYDDRLELAYVGYVREVGIKTPVVIECEDEMYSLKHKPCRKLAYRSVSIRTLLADQGLKDVRVFGEQELGQYRVEDDTVASLLGRLQRNGIRSFYRLEDGKPVLYCGVLFERDNTKAAQVFATGLNLISYSQLKQQKAEDVRLLIKAISIMPNNKRIKVEVGDQDGARRTLHAYNKKEADLRAWAEQELRRLKVDGLTGSFTTFGAQLVDKLDNVGVKIDGQRMGIYQVRKNVIKYSTSGYRQEITLGQRVRD